MLAPAPSLRPAQMTWPETPLELIPRYRRSASALHVKPRHRGLQPVGVAEARAARSGAVVARRETNRALVEAIALYRSAGYDEVRAFNDEPFADHWFEKRLV